MIRFLRCTITLVPLVLVGCSDTMKAALDAQERPLHVTCFSGGIPILDDVSVAGVEWDVSGILYRSGTTHRMIKGGADCLVVDEDPPRGWKPLIPGRGRIAPISRPAPGDLPEGHSHSSIGET